MKHLQTGGALLAAAMLLAGCGGAASGHSAGAPADSTGSGELTPGFFGPAIVSNALQLTGTAATGPVMQGGLVEVKCAHGTGSGTTDANGVYTVTVDGGVLPCIVRVTGEVDTAPVTLHSVAEVGMPVGGIRTAVANLTPVTEMILAQTTGAMPHVLFDTFESSYTRVTQDAVTEAANQVIEALWIYANISMGTIDPLAGQVFTYAGHRYEFRALMEPFWARLEIAALPHLVNKLAIAKARGEHLYDTMRSLYNGNLPGCGAALSGKYRFVTYHGKSWARDLDFNLKLMTDFKAPSLATAAIRQDPEQLCRFVIETSDGTIETVIGPAGVGAWHQVPRAGAENILGYIFPVQSHSLASLAGRWITLSSGIASVTGRDSMSHFVEEMEFDTSGGFAAWAYDTMTWECLPYPEEFGRLSLVLSDRPDVFAPGNMPGSWRYYAYRAPSGASIIFGASDVTDWDKNNKVALVGARAGSAKPPTLGEFRNWEFSHVGSIFEYRITGPTLRESRVLTADPSSRTFTARQDGETETFQLDKPIAGMRYRLPRTIAFESETGEPIATAGMIQFPFDDFGLVVTINDDTPLSYADDTHTYVISVKRP